MNHKTLRAAILLLIAIGTIGFMSKSLTKPVTAAGNTYYVSPSGSNSNSGTSSGSPLQTISSALNKMSGGDTLRLSGTFTGKVTIPTSLSGTSANPTIIESYGSGEAKITSPTNNDQVLRIEASYLTLRNITVDGTAPNHNGNATCLFVGPSTAKNVDNVLIDNVKVQNCEGQGLEFRGNYISGAPRYVSGTIRNSSVQSSSLYTLSDPGMGSGWQSGIKVAKYGKDILIENNTISNNWGEGVAITRGENITFRNNDVSNNFSVNIYIDNSINTKVQNNFSYCLNAGQSGAVTRNGNTANAIVVGEEYYGDSPLWGNQLTGVEISNNLVYNCSRAMAWFGTDSGTGGLDNALIANNTFYITGNQNSAIYFSGESGDDIKAYNNIFVETGSGSAGWIDTPNGTYDFNNNYWSSTPSPSQFKGGNDVYNTVANLKFTGTPGTDVTSFRLGSGSAAIDKGRSLTANGITKDYFGGSRSGTFDIGAHEFGSTPTSSTTTSTNTSTSTDTSTSTSTSTSTGTTSSTSDAAKADYNKDGVVGIADFTIFARYYKVDGIDCKYDLIGNDCKLTIEDFIVFANNYKKSV